MSQGWCRYARGGSANRGCSPDQGVPITCHRAMGRPSGSPMPFSLSLVRWRSVVAPALAPLLLGVGGDRRGYKAPFVHSCLFFSFAPADVHVLVVVVLVVVALPGVSLHATPGGRRRGWACHGHVEVPLSRRGPRCPPPRPREGRQIDLCIAAPSSPSVSPLC